MQIVGLDHVQLAMPPGGEAAARAFYGELLGLVQVPKPAALAARGGCWFEGPDAVIHLGVEQDFAPARKAHPALRVADLAALEQRLAAAGVPLTPDDTLPRVRRCYAADPFGNRIEFIQDGQGFAQMSQPALDLQSSYDRVAGEYARRIFDELAHKPLDRQLLDRFAGRVQELGPACDMGCGPGHVARYLHDRGVRICGMDLAPGMLEQARRLNPDIPFIQGNMLALGVVDEAWAGITAFYAIIHIPREAVVQALREFKRVLRPGGLLLLAFHVGEETVHLEAWWDQPVSIDFTFFRPDEMVGYLQTAGFVVEEVIERDPYPDVEHQSRRCYIFARKPEESSPASTRLGSLQTIV